MLSEELRGLSGVIERAVKHGIESGSCSKELGDIIHNAIVEGIAERKSRR